MSELVRLSTPADGVTVVTLDNPPLNLVTVDLIDQLEETLTDIAADRSTRAVILASTGDRAFCAGSDVAEFMDIRDDVVARKSRRENGVWRALELLPQPTIAAIAAPAVGGGFELALCCDMRVVAETAWFAFPELNLAVYPGSGGTYRLARLVGLTRAFELLYTGDRLDSATALEWGVASEVTPADTVLGRAVERATQLAAAPALAVQAVKQAVYASCGRSWEDVEPLLLALTERVFASEDVVEGVAAFRERRAPNFRHR